VKETEREKKRQREILFVGTSLPVRNEGMAPPPPPPPPTPQQTKPKKKIILNNSYHYT